MSKKMSRTDEMTNIVIEFVKQMLKDSDGESVKDFIEEWTMDETKVALKEAIKNSVPPRARQSSGTKKDKTGPKRGLNSYQIYCKENRVRVKEENPNMKPTEIVTELAREWKLLDELDKKSWKAKAEEDKERYEREKSESDKSDNGDKNDKGGKSDKGGKAEEKVARKKSAYIIFQAEMRQSMGDDYKDRKSDLTAEINRMWKEDFPKAEDRAPWQKAADIANGKSSDEPKKEEKKSNKGDKGNKVEKKEEKKGDLSSQDDKSIKKLAEEFETLKKEEEEVAKLEKELVKDSVTKKIEKAEKIEKIKKEMEKLKKEKKVEKTEKVVEKESEDEELELEDE